MIIVFIYMVHDTENLTFSEEFRGCSARNDTDFPHRCCGTSAREDTDFPCWRARRRTWCATTVKDRETRRKDCSKYHYRNRTC